LLISGRALIPFALDRSGLAEDPVTAEPLPAHSGAAAYGLPGDRTGRRNERLRDHPPRQLWRSGPNL